jgi:hypothetical protein
MFSIAPQFYPISFGKCCLPFTYIGGPIDEKNKVQYFAVIHLSLSLSLSFCLEPAWIIHWPFQGASTLAHDLKFSPICELLLGPEDTRDTAPST